MSRRSARAREAREHAAGAHTPEGEEAAAPAHAQRRPTRGAGMAKEPPRRELQGGSSKEEAGEHQAKQGTQRT